jgi:Tfp pilus assembly protein PilV
MSIQRIHDRLVAGHEAARDDAGLSMTEVITALFVFTIFILGLGYSLLSMTRLVGDDANREVAAALASQEIDRVRAIPDAFDVLSKTTTQVVGGTTFTINRTAGWVTANGSTASCGSGGGNLQDKAVDVEVTWVKQYVKTSPIRSTTIIAPTTRINDPSFGTIIVSTLGADGTGRGNIPISVVVTPGKTGTAPAASTLDPTDSSGCSYVLKVAPGTYTVGVSKANYISSTLTVSAPFSQVASPTQQVTVVAGGSAPATFQYDVQATYSVTYGPTISGSLAKLPDALATTFLNSSDGVQKNATTTAGTQYLFPYTSGYSAVAGDYAVGASPTSGCQSIDPTAWSAGTVNGVPLAAGTQPATAVAAGASGPFNVPMGAVAVTWPAGNTVKSIQLQSAAAPAGTGDPGCFTAPKYTYTFASAPTGGTTSYLAAPFGSYQAYTVVGSLLTLLTGGPTLTNATRGELTGNVITLDPRNPS